MEVDIINTEKSVVKSVPLNEKVFGAKVNEGLLHSSVVSHLANLRRGTVGVKDRSLVKGSNKKPWKQKGTGNARAGTVTSPLWRGGGVTFGPQARDYSFKINRKCKKAAMLSALSLKAEKKQLVILEKFDLKEVKTKELAKIVKEIGVTRSGLLVLEKEDRNLSLSARNIPGVKAQRVETLNVYDILAHETLVLTEGALHKIEERLTNE